MNPKLEHILEKASQTLDMPIQLAAGMPRIELRGSNEAILESHSGVREYGENMIIVDTPLGPARICGNELTIRAMNEDKIIINGTIVSFEYI
ncbi:MAG: sporulation protein [Ruminococcaceae bacterium]|nr:sporulation protein [Oscillospiraceae bacterium]